MRIRNVTARPRGVTPADGDSFLVEAGETVEVSDALGKSLCAQPRNWQPVEETTHDDEGEH